MDTPDQSVGPFAMLALKTVDWTAVRAHYDERFDIHKRLLKLHDGHLTEAFVKLLLGISDGAANYSARDHGLGPRILTANVDAPGRVDKLAREFRALDSARRVPQIIRSAGLSYLAIGVGSEASCMVNPEVCWVANTRTIWSHLAIKHGDNTARADEELALYRDSDPSSEMAYRIWAEIHRLLEVSMVRLAELGDKEAAKAGVKPGRLKFIWADAIANSIYSEHHEST